MALHELIHPDFHKLHLEEHGIALHFLSAPDHGDPHDHPQRMESTVKVGGYVEEVFDLQTGRFTVKTRTAGNSFVIEATHIHRIVEIIGPYCITEIRYGPVTQRWSHWRWDDNGPLQSFEREHIFRPYPRR